PPFRRPRIPLRRTIRPGSSPLLLRLLRVRGITNPTSPHPNHHLANLRIPQYALVLANTKEPLSLLPPNNGPRSNQTPRPPTRPCRPRLSHRKGAISPSRISRIRTLDARLI